MSGVAQGKRSRAALWLMIAVATAPVAASYLFYYFWEPGRTVNYGELIEPRPLPELQLTLVDGSPFRLSQLRGRWVLAMLDSGRCDAACDTKLLYMRQLRLTQGKDMERVERAWFIIDGTVPRPEAVEPYRGTWLVRAGGADLVRLFPAPESASDHIYLMDPLGNLMMRFPRDPDPKGMIRDLTRLLKASRIG